MRNLKFTIAYNGSAYNGYQSQPTKNTVQDIVENALSRFINQKAVINGCSRTDAGVHAKEFVFNIKYDESLSTIDTCGIMTAMNGFLPPDIVILSCETVSESFHARFDAKGKEYLYIIDNSKVRNVFSHNMSLHYPYELDIKKMSEAAKIIIGKHDFSAFCKAEAKEHLKTAIRTVFDIRIEENEKKILFYVSGDGFLHNMVRIIVGTLIYVSEGKLSFKDVEDAIESGCRTKAGKTLPACGLYLNKVFY